MNAIILFCPHLGRDIGELQARIPDARIIEGVQTTPGEVGCLDMHQKAVWMAIEEGWDRVAVFEDDCLLTSAFSWERWCEAADWAKANGYGAVHGGSVKTFNPRKVDQHYIAVDYACSAHAMIYLESAYEAVLSAEQPLDWSIGQKGGKPVLIWPFVAIQRASLSGIGRPVEASTGQQFAGPMPVNYERSFKRHEERLGRRHGMGA